jgi:hypothetical protein
MPTHALITECMCALLVPTRRPVGESSCSSPYAVRTSDGSAVSAYIVVGINGDVVAIACWLSNRIMSFNNFMLLLTSNISSRYILYMKFNDILLTFFYDIKINLYYLF